MKRKIVLKIKTNGKINLFLRVLEKDDTNLHKIESLMIPYLKLFDHIKLSIYTKKKSNKIDLTTKNNLDLPFSENFLKNNLVVQCINEIRKIRDFKYDIKVNIVKNYQEFSGFGSGSANAMGVLLALDEKFILNLTQVEKIKIATLIGSDASFFLFNKPSIVRDYGNTVQPIVLNKIKFNVISLDNIKCNTKEVYNNYIFDNKIERPTFLQLIEEIKNERFSNLYNDLQASIFNTYPKFKETYLKICKEYDESKYKIIINGSGSSLICLKKNEKKH